MSVHPPCPVCGWSYLRGDPADERNHRRLHRPYERALNWRPRLPSDLVIAREGARRVVGVPPSAPLTARERVQKLTSHANLETRYDFPMYEARDVDELDRHGLVAIEDGALGLLILDRRPRCDIRRATWEDYEGNRNDRVQPYAGAAEGVWTVAFVWVRSQSRRSGVASLLARCSAEFADTVPDGLAWLMPFRREGAALARSLCPEGFLFTS